MDNVYYGKFQDSTFDGSEDFILAVKIKKSDIDIQIGGTGLFRKSIPNI